MFTYAVESTLNGLLIITLPGNSTCTMGNYHNFSDEWSFIVIGCSLLQSVFNIVKTYTHTPVTGCSQFAIRKYWKKSTLFLKVSPCKNTCSVTATLKLGFVSPLVLFHLVKWLEKLLSSINTWPPSWQRNGNKHIAPPWIGFTAICLFPC